MATKRISDAAYAILAECSVVDGVVILPPGQLERLLYQEVDGALRLLGGKWDRRKGGHVFPWPDGRIGEMLAETLNSGAATGKEGFWETPDAVIDRMLELAEVTFPHAVLEPSAGRGAIARRVYPLCGPLALIERDEDFRDDLLKIGGRGSRALVLTLDFFRVTPVNLWPVDRVLMNPPFERGQDAQHVRHAYKFLRPGGRLVAIMSAGARFRSDHAAVQFREWLGDLGGYLHDLPDGSFKASGTGVNAVICVVDR